MSNDWKIQQPKKKLIAFVLFLRNMEHFFDYLKEFKKKEVEAFDLTKNKFEIYKHLASCSKKDLWFIFFKKWRVFPVYENF